MARLKRGGLAALLICVALALILLGCALLDTEPSTTTGETSGSNQPSGGSSSTTAPTPSTTTAPATTSAPVTTSGPVTTTMSVTTTAPATTTSASTSASTSTSTSASTSTTEPATGTPATNYSRLPTKEKVVALTFDAAYDPAPLKGILAALDEAGAAATFFLTGEFIEDFPEWTKKIIGAGYPIGNHSYSHPDFTTISESKMRSEIQRTAALLVELGGSDPRPLFRAPHGALNKKVLSVVGGEGYVSVYWTIDTLDWKTDRTTAQIKNTVFKNLQPGAIILMHVGSKQEAEVLPEILSEIKARGYGFVSLRDALPGAGG